MSTKKLNKTGDMLLVMLNLAGW